jgi:hypothetical protein
MDPENFVMPFGMHKGKTLAEIRDEGEILYLDWLRGERNSDKKAATDPLDKAIVTFLEENEEEVEGAMLDRDDRRWGDCPEDHF